MPLLKIQQVPSRDALEVVPLFDRSNFLLPHSIEGCYKAKAMLPTLAAQVNSAWLLRAKLLGEARKSMIGLTYYNIQELIRKIQKRKQNAPEKSVYQLQAGLGNTFIWERANVLSYGDRTEKIADRIKDAQSLDNNEKVDNNCNQNLQRDVILCFNCRLWPELVIPISSPWTGTLTKSFSWLCQKRTGGVA